jgi:hypothetical protein
MEKPAKYPKEVIRDIAERLQCGMICYLNPETNEVEDILGDSYCEDTSDEYYKEYINDVNSNIKSWKEVITIRPMESRDSFEIMEGFINDCIVDDNQMKIRLLIAIEKKKPFQNFKYIIDNSEYRQQWFDYLQEKYENYVLRELEDWDELDDDEKERP